MFFFHVSAYKIQGDSPLPNVIDLNTLEKLDENALISYLDIPYTGFNTTVLKSDIASELISLIGEENYLTISLIFGRTVANQQNDLNNCKILLQQIPSISKAYPNTIAELEEYLSHQPSTDANDIWRFKVILHFKNLGISQSPGWGSYYTMNGSVGTAQSTGANIPYFAMGFSPQGIYLYGYENYKAGDDLTDLSKWYKVGITMSYSRATANIIQTRVDAGEAAGIVIIFNSDTVPDGQYGPINPYEPADPSAPGDLPPGTFDDTSDPIPVPSIPTLSASDTGFTRIYNPTLSQVKELAQYLWTEPSLLETLWNHIKQFFEDPMDAMIGFNLVPVPVPDGGTTEFKVMYIGTGVMMTAAASQFVDVDCGSVQLDRYYGSALDQSPYTKVQCFLPYIGMVQLNTDEVMGTTLSVKYRVDIVSGSCVAYILVDGNALYQYSGHCAITIPFSSADFSSYVNAAIQVAKMVAIGAGSAVANMATDTVQDPGQSTNQLTRTVTETTTERNAATGRQITTGTRTWSETRDVPQTATRASFSGLTPQNVANTVAQVMSSKPAIQHSGSFSGNSGYLGVRRPYLVIERPNMCLPANYQSLNGYPSMITLTLGDCQGFTRVQQVQLTGVWATEPEQAEILQLLKTGVIL